MDILPSVYYVLCRWAYWHVLRGPEYDVECKVVQLSGWIQRKSGDTFGIIPFEIPPDKTGLNLGLRFLFFVLPKEYMAGICPIKRMHGWVTVPPSLLLAWQCLWMLLKFSDFILIGLLLGGHFPTYLKFGLTTTRPVSVWQTKGSLWDHPIYPNKCHSLASRESPV